jgi:hypothetical protein
MTLEEFLAGLERYKSSKPEGGASATDFNSFQRHLVETGQQDDPIELIVAREAALATTGPYAEWTPEMAYNYHFGDREAFYTAQAAQVRARHPFLASSAQPASHSEDLAARKARLQARHSRANLIQPTRPPKRAAAERAPDVWAGLAQRKKQRRQ